MVVGLLPRVLLLPSIKPNCPLIIIMIAVPQCSLAKGMFLSQQNIFISAKYFCLDKMFLSGKKHFHCCKISLSQLDN